MGRNRSLSDRNSSKRKSSKARKRMKTKTTKSKKLRHCKVSSSYSTDGSSSSVSVSSFSSEHEHHKVHSRKLTKLKGRKKRARERSSAKRDKFSKIKKPQKKKLRREPSLTSISSYSTNSDCFDTKKKLRKKRRTREPSITSISSDLHSDGSSEGYSHRGRSIKKSKGERDLGKSRSMKVRSRSNSPPDRYNEGNDSSSKPIFPVENNSRRLRSVITFVKSRENEEQEWDRDSVKEEMVLDHRDYQSCRNDGSGDGDNKGDLPQYSCADLETRNVEIPKIEEALTSDCRLTELTGGGDGEINKPGDDNEREVDRVLRNAENDDLESMLRLKALENMIKYKGAQLEKLKAPSKSGIFKVEERSPPVVEQSADPWKTQKATPTPVVTITSEPSSLLVNTQKATSTPVVKSEYERITMAKKIQKIDSSVADNNLGVTSESVRMANKNGDEQDNNVPTSFSEPSSSSLKPALEGHSLKENQSIDKDGSQFEQKTMSVMRGGEMVQVSYKVYIPKKAPALARRPLRR